MSFYSQAASSAPRLDGGIVSLTGDGTTKSFAFSYTSGAFNTAPLSVVAWLQGATLFADNWSTTWNNTQLVITFNAAPSAGQVYRFSYIALGNPN